MSRAIIFDLGGVVLRHRADLIGYILSQIFPLSKEEGDKIWFEYRVRLLIEELSSEDFLREIKDKTGIKLSEEELLRKWKELYIANARIDWAVLDFVTELRRKYKVYLLTDTIDIHDQYNKNRGIDERFDRVFKSIDEKLSKAEGSKLYLEVLKKLNLEPFDCIFIDDLEENILTVKSLGAKGIVFKNLE